MFQNIILGIIRDKHKNEQQNGNRRYILLPRQYEFQRLINFRVT